MRMKLSAVGFLLAASALGCGDEGDDGYRVDASGATAVDGGGSGPDAAVIPPVEAGTALDGGSPVVDAATPRDTGVAPLDASATPDAAGLDAATSADASGAGDGGGGTDGGPRDGGTADGGGDAGGTTFTRVFAIFQETCGTTCHGNTARGGLNMSTKSMAFTELTSPGNAEGTCMGNNRKRVVPLMPEMSLLIKKLEGTQDCGQRMPEGRAALSAAQIGEVRSWISAGAMNN
jgi:hypothetical protein